MRILPRALNTSAARIDAAPQQTSLWLIIDWHRTLPSTGRVTTAYVELHAMLTDWHEALRTLIHQRGAVDRNEVAVTFDAPVRQWVGALRQPTINFFLFDLQENTELRQSSPDISRAVGRGISRVPPRRFNVRYLVSALTTVVDDEHLLIWRTLGTLMKHPTIPVELLPASVTQYGLPVTAKIAPGDDGPRALDLWSALESPPRPSLIYTVTLPLDLDLEVQAPLVLTRTTRYADTAAPERVLMAPVSIGGRVRDFAGQPVAGVNISIDGRVGGGTVSDADGQFVLSGLANGKVVLRVQRDGGAAKLVPIDIPATSYDVITD